MELRKRVNVSKTSTDKYSWEVTVEFSGSLLDWGTQFNDENATLTLELQKTADLATAEIKRQIGGDA